MKRDEAQFILTAYRPNGADASSSAFGEALQMAGIDPDLGKWLAREQEMDRLVCEKLSSVQPPANLHDRILAGARVSRKRSWFFHRSFIALAACVSLALLAAWHFRPVTGRNLPEFAMHYGDRGFFLQHHDKELNGMKNWLAANHMPTPQSIPAGLAALEKLGCRTTTFNGRPVSIICFEKNGREFHLFVVRKTGRVPSESGQRLATSGHWSSASWSDSENDYVLATHGDPQSLERLLVNG